MSDLLNRELRAKPNPDLAKERRNANVNIEKLQAFFGKLLFASTERHKEMIVIREKLVNEIEPITYNFYNLSRKEQYDFCFKKSLEFLDFIERNNITHPLERNYLSGPILATEKQLFTLHNSMVRNSVELWSTEEQKMHWLPRLDKYENIVTYAQTELGHGTYVRGLETVVTYDKATDELIIDSPTITSYKYWPGSMGKTVNTAIVMAKLVLDGKDYGIHAFMVPFRDSKTHKPFPNIEVGDIGPKFGFNSQDNGYIAFHKYRIPRFNMFMNFAQVSRDGKFTRTGSELLMYASMLLMRATLCMFASLMLSMSLTISIRYSCVRRQTANPEGIEPPVLDYQTQQYRLFPGLSACYAIFFTSFNFRNILNIIQKESNNLKSISKPALAQLHAMSSAIKAFAFDHTLQYTQISRLSCGGHGYSGSSGLGQLIVEADAGSTYEGDNIVLYLQTARYLLKCAQSGESPFYKSKVDEKLVKSPLYLKNKPLVDLYYEVYERAIAEVGEKMFTLIKEHNQSEYDAWNNCSAVLVNVAKLYINIFVIISNITFICQYAAENGNDTNTEALMNLFELYLLYGLTNTYAASFAKLNSLDPERIKGYEKTLFSLLPLIRKNAIYLTDAFDWTDSGLCSSLGCYDGNAYERLLDYARNSEFNKKDPADQFEKYLKPFVERQQSKL